MPILRAKDKSKDQSYFLWKIKQQQLSKTLFPIGEFESKAFVRQKAEEMDLITATKKDSQGLCFVGQTPVRELLLQTLGSKPGEIVTYDGDQKKVLGSHSGAYLYTIGQRQGLGLSGGPWFVIKIDIDKNEVVVAHLEQVDKLLSQVVLVNNFNWQVSVNVDQILLCQAQIRYRQLAQNCQIIFNKTQLQSTQYSHLETNFEKGSSLVIFDSPVRAATRGQSLVFYDNETMLGGAVIEKIIQ